MPKKKVKIKQKARVKKKKKGGNDTIPKAPAKMYRDTGANFKVKIKRKND